MDYDEALFWCMERKVRILTNGGALRLVIGSTEVVEPLPDDRWSTHREAFLRAVRRLRQVVEHHEAGSGVFRISPEVARALGRVG